MKFLILCILSACATTETPTIVPRTIAPGDALTLKWSVGQNRACEDCTPRWTVDCGHEIGHPCPYLLFTTKLGIQGPQTVFGLATGGSDSNNVPAEDYRPWAEPFVLDGECLSLRDAGDNGGFRHPAELCPDILTDGIERDAYVGDIEWSLFTQAGYTTFHVEAVFQ